jgi:hypothetical protein
MGQALADTTNTQDILKISSIRNLEQLFVMKPEIV